MTRTNIVIPSGGKVDVAYLEDLADQLDDVQMPKMHSFKLQD